MNDRQAPELRVARWIDGAGRPAAPLSLNHLGAGLRVIYCFQHWCPGCHSAGFPARVLTSGRIAIGDAVRAASDHQRDLERAR